MKKAVSLHVKNFFTEGNTRSILAKKNILYGFLIKGGSIFISLLIVPVTINFATPNQYGVWLTLSSMIGWLSFFDIGLGNGLRNKLSKANAEGDLTSAKVYVSTTYALLFILSISLFLIFYTLNHFLNWDQILNTQSFSFGYLNKAIGTLITFFCLQFIVQTISVVLIAHHEPAKSSFITLVSSLVSLLIISLSSNLFEDSFITLIYVFGGVPPVIFLLFSLYFYNNKFSKISPSLKFVKFTYVKSLLGVGVVFFFIQMAVVIIYQTDNIIISHLFGSTVVTEFNIAYKYFWIVVMLFSIVATPLWSAFTDAFVKQDLAWINSIYSRLHKLWVLLILLTLIMLCVSSYVYEFWIGPNVRISSNLSIVLSVYVIVYLYHAYHVYLLNGIGKIRLQLYLVIFGSIINIPLAIFLGKKLGLIGVPISNIIVLVFISVFVTIQNKKILNNTADGLWYK